MKHVSDIVPLEYGVFGWEIATVEVARDDNVQISPSMFYQRRPSVQLGNLDYEARVMLKEGDGELEKTYDEAMDELLAYTKTQGVSFMVTVAKFTLKPERRIEFELIGFKDDNPRIIMEGEE